MVGCGKRLYRIESFWYDRGHLHRFGRDFWHMTTNNSVTNKPIACGDQNYPPGHPDHSRETDHLLCKDCAIKEGLLW